ncbi:hypothetical protein SESBI_25248 [Sesbania bispinosa]|nr:hypothetical protein SESBI_25248 [Sesbania bispinosa]
MATVLRTSTFWAPPPSHHLPPSPSLRSPHLSPSDIKAIPAVPYHSLPAVRQHFPVFMVVSEEKGCV